jgi:hypothetical protein
VDSTTFLGLSLKNARGRTEREEFHPRTLGISKLRRRR